MKQTTAIALLAAFLCLLTACQDHTEANSPDTTTTATTTTTTTVTSTTESTTTTTTEAATTTTTTTTVTTTRSTAKKTAAKTTAKSTAPKTTTQKPTTTTKPKTTSTTAAPYSLDKAVFIKVEHEGIWKSWIEDNDVVYAAFRGPNELVRIDVKAQTETVLELPAMPHEVQLIDGELYVSFPQLQCLRVYDPRTLAEKRTIDLHQRVGSFAVSGDWIYFAEDQMECRIFTHCITTGDTELFIKSTYCQPVVCVNEDLQLLYVAESNLSNCRFISFRLTDGSVQSQFKNGINDRCSTRFSSIFLVEDELYWADFKLNAADVSKIKGHYNLGIGGDMLQANETYVVTTTGIYHADTYTPLLKIEDPKTRVLVTRSKYILFIEQTDEDVYF